MKKRMFTIVCLALMVGIAPVQQQAQNPPQKRQSLSAKSTKQPSSGIQNQLPHPMSAEEAFFYYTAIFGEELNNSFIYGAANNVVDRYALAFDQGNYARAMSDEFSRAQYRERIRARIAAGVRRVDFNQKFSVTGGGGLGEYHFPSHSFPLNSGVSSGFCLGPSCSNLRVDVFNIQEAVNGRDFYWSLAMPESEASAFLKSRALPGGGNNRGVFLRVAYSIVPLKGRPAVQGSTSVPQQASLKPFIYSVDIYSDRNMTKKLGTLRKVPLTPSTPEEMRATEERIKEEAPGKLREFLASAPVLEGIYLTGYGSSKATLRVLSFDSNTGAVSAEVDYIGSTAPSGWEYSPSIRNSVPGHSSRAVGQASGDILNLTATWNVKNYFGEMSTDSMHFRLRFDEPTRKLAGPWCNGTAECADGPSTASFDLR